MLTDTYTRDSEESGYRANVARKIMDEYPTIKSVEIHERGDGLPKSTPRPGVAVYVMSTGGKWGRSAEKRIHHSDETARAAARAEAEKQAAWTPDLAELRDELSGDPCYRLYVARHGYGYSVMLSETLHEVGGSFSYRVKSAEEARKLIAEMRSKHDDIYHPEQCGC